MEIERRIEGALSGDRGAAALAFAGGLRGMGLVPKQYEEGGDGYSIMRGGDSVGFFAVPGEGGVPGAWTVWFNSCDFGGGEGVSDGLRRAAWDHASVCGNYESGGKVCGCGDQPGFTREIFGREFKNRCHSPLMFIEPSGEDANSALGLFALLAGGGE